MKTKDTHELEALAKAWRQPSRGDGYAGFWSINHVSVDGRPDDQEFRWQLNQLHAKGMREAVVWLRSGHGIPYLSDRWGSIVETILSECKHLGMKAWFWDEDPFVQGTARGITHEHPEFRGRVITSEVQTIQGGRPVQLRLPLAARGVSPLGAAQPFGR